MPSGRIVRISYICRITYGHSERMTRYSDYILWYLLINGQRSRRAAGHEKIFIKAVRRAPKTALRPSDLDHAKTAVLNSLTCPHAQCGYQHAIDEFVNWYCSEPHLAFNKTVVLQYRIHLESRKLAPGTINLRLGAVRRLAYEASDCGLLSPDLAAGIRRVKEVKKLGVRLGNWLTAEQSQALWQAPDAERLKGISPGEVLQRWRKPASLNLGQ